MEKLDQFYLDRWSQKSDWTEIGPTKRKRLENLILFIEKNIPNSSEIKLIDYGCGSGWLFHYLHEYGIKNLYGYDVTPSTLKLIQGKYPYVKGLWSPGSSFSEEVPKSNFDFCTSIEVIEHVPFSKKGNYLKEIHSILKEGGYLYLTTPNGNFYKTGIKENEKQPIEDWSTPNELLKLITSAGFKVHSKGSFFFKPNMSLIHKILLNPFLNKSYLKNTLNAVLGKGMLGLSTYYFCQKSC